jgi:hypothetical protein
MSSIDYCIHELADRMHCPDGPPAERRAKLEETLLPMVRCALRTGRGHRHLVDWVQQTLPTLRGDEDGPAVQPPETVAGPMTRLLCQALLLHEMRTRPRHAAAKETVLGH